MQGLDKPEEVVTVECARLVREVLLAPTTDSSTAGYALVLLTTCSPVELQVLVFGRPLLPLVPTPGEAALVDADQLPACIQQLLDADSQVVGVALPVEQTT